MKNTQYVFFDLDGTMIDTKQGIVNSLIYALDYMGIEEKHPKELVKFIGPPLRESFQKYYGFTPMRADLAVEKYREYYEEKGLMENQLYPGIPQLLAQLKDEKKELMVATSKPTRFAEMVLSQHKLTPYFSFVSGATLDASRAGKIEVLEYAMQKQGIKNGKGAVMIGDRIYDVLGAKVFNMESIGVTYGYGSREELEEAQATCVVDSVPEIGTILL